MREIEVHPNQVRALGNILDTKTIEDFTGYHCNVTDAGILNINNVDLPVFNIKLKGISTIIEVETISQSIFPGGSVQINVKIKKSSTDELVTDANLDVYFYENDIPLGTIETVGGECSFNYSSTVEGTHNLLIKTVSQHEYDGTETTLPIFVYRPTTIQLSATPMEPEMLEPVTLSAKLTANIGELAGKTIRFYNDGLLIGESITDNEGVATLILDPKGED